MGCNSSKEISDEDEYLSNRKSLVTMNNSDADNDLNAADDDDKTLETLCVAWMEEFGTIKFPSLIGGKRLWYLDEFKPKGSKEKVKMWKEAVIDFVDTSRDCVYLKLSPKNKVRERIVDLNSEWSKLALPAMNLSKEQRIKGQELSDEQVQKAYSLLRADYTYEDEMKMSVSNTNDELEQSGFFDESNYSIGKEVDIQDVFLAKGRKEIKSKWRKAKIIDTPSPDTIRVHFIGWDDRWDETIDLHRDADRIKPGGTMTGLNNPSPTRKLSRSSSGVTRGEKSLSLSSPSSTSDMVDRTLNRSKSHSHVSDSVASADIAFGLRMKRAGMDIIRVEGDGNCLFRAVAHQMFLDQSRHMEIRMECVDHMKRHRERFQTFCTSNFDEYLKRMSLPGQWGDDLEIRALEEIIDRPFYIYSSDSKKDLIPTPINTSYRGHDLSGSDIAPIKLSYHGRSHYNSVIDDQITLPLELRSSSSILQSRLKIFDEDRRKSIRSKLDLKKIDLDDSDEEWTRSTEISSER